MNSVYIHHIDPFAIQFTETFGIRWYGLAYLGGFMMGYFLIYLKAKRGTVDLAPERVGDFITAVAIGTLVGGRIGYCVFYRPELLVQFSGEFPYWGLLEVHKGGMASHGGMIGIMVASALFAKFNRLRILHLIDLTCLGGSAGILFGRIANFINGELYGREAPATLPWAVKFPQELYRWVELGLAGDPDKPNRMRENLEKLGAVAEKLSPMNIGANTMSVTQDTWSKWVNGGGNFARGSIENVVSFLVTQAELGNAKVLEVLGPVLTPRHPSQIYQGLMEGLVVMIILALIWLKPRKPGVIAGWFGITYCIARIIGEEFRTPDAHIMFEALGLTRGQWLSIGLFVIAVGYLVFALTRDAEKTGGWKKRL